MRWILLALKGQVQSKTFDRSPGPIDIKLKFAYKKKMTNERKKSRLAIGKYLIYPKIQIKYAGIYTFIVVLTLCIFMVGEFFFLSRGEQFGLDQGVLDSFKISLLKYNLIVLCVSAALTFFVSILVTHRFLGPIVAINRALASYSVDRKFKKIVIRKTDEVHSLVEQLNKFFEGLDEK